MPSKPVLIHTHFHRRRTGLTRSVENVFPYFEGDFDSYIFGHGIKGRKIKLLALLKFVFSKKYFVLHCHRNNELLRALLLKMLGGNFKLIATRHAESIPSKLTNYLLQKADDVISLTNEMQKKLTFESIVIGHGVDVDRFKPKPSEKRKEIRQKNLLTCAGRLRLAKGQKELLITLSPILKKFPDWAMVFVGRADKPEFLNELKEISLKNKIENQVYFIDETPEIISYYQASHSVIVPSFSEGFSLVCAEAMACGCNVIATEKVGVHSDIIQNGENGYLFGVEDSSKLKEILNSLCSGDLEHLGRNARKTIIDDWSAKQEADNLIELYKK